MRVEVTWTACREHVGDQPCANCGGRFWLAAATAYAVSDRGILLGEVCPACIAAGPEHMATELERRARWSRMVAAQDEEFASESFEECPTLDEFLALEAALGAPLFATIEEAEAEMASTREPGCARSLVGRKESLMERRSYVGGVSEEQRSPLERRADELGIEKLFWTELESRVDDLETELAKLKAEK